MEFHATTGRKRSRNKILLLVSLALVVLFAAVAGFFFWQWQSLKSNPNIEAQATSTRLIEKVGKIYDLPKDEKPTVALISDKNKLKDQSFFEKAQNGDYLIMYTNAKLALLYREKENKLINVGPITIQDDSQQQTKTEQTEQNQTSGQDQDAEPSSTRP
jgi:hypothetical protein